MATFGYTTAGASNQAMFTPECTFLGSDNTGGGWPLSVAGSVSQISIYANSVTSSVNTRGEIYDTTPSALQGAGDLAQVVTTTTGWFNLAYSTPLSLTAASYWIGFGKAGSVDLDLFYDSATSYSGKKYSAGYTTPANPLVTPNNYNNRKFSIYATYTAGGGTTITGDLGISSASSVTFNGISSGQSLGISSVSSVAFVGQQTNQSDVSISSISAVNWNTSTGESNLVISSASAVSWVGATSTLGNSFSIAATSAVAFVGQQINKSDLSISSTSSVTFVSAEYHVSNWLIQAVSTLGWMATTPTTVTADWSISSTSTLSFVGSITAKAAMGISAISALTWDNTVTATSPDLNGWLPESVRMRQREKQRIALINQEDDEIMLLIKAALPYLEGLH